MQTADLAQDAVDALKCAAQHVVALPGQPLCKRLAYEVVRAADLSESDWPSVLRGIKVLNINSEPCFCQKVTHRPRPPQR